MDLYLLKFNNYYNRIVKKFDTLAEYLSAPYYNGDVVENLAFDPNDNVNTYQIVNTNYSCDYAVLADGNEIISRWFVIETKRLRNRQWQLQLRRDLIVDNYTPIINAPCFIEKATVNNDDPAIFNKENISFNQIKTSETLLKDRSGCPWIVGYYAKDYVDKDDPEKSLIIDESDPATTVKTADISINGTIDTWEYYQFVNNSNFVKTEKLLNYSVKWYQNQRIPIENISKINYVTHVEKNNISYEIASLSTNSTIISNALSREVIDTQNQAIKNAINFEDLEALDLSAYSGYIEHTQSEFNNLKNMNGKILSCKTATGATQLYQIQIYQTNVSKQIKPETGSSAYILMANGMNELIANGTFTGDVSNDCFNITISADEALSVRLKEYTGITAYTSINKKENRFNPLGQPYAMFAIPYGEIEIKHTAQGIAGFKTSPEISLAVAYKLIEKYSGSGTLYDVQLLPYCPLQNIITSDGIIDFDENESKLFQYINHKESSQIIHVGVIFNCDTNSFSFNIEKNINIDNIKISNECDLYRLVSPNFNGQFEFSAAKNGGVNFFNVDCDYRPYTPYIHINPDFKRLYGEDFNDPRGLICGGDFGLTQISDAWQNYQIQNKNYQEIFNRQIQNMETNNAVQKEREAWQTAAGAVGGGIGGAIAGGIAGPIGAAVGGIVGAGASAIAGARDIELNNKLRNEAIDFSKDNFGYQLGNIKALPDNLTKVSSFNQNNKLFPILEYYTCTETEKQALINKIKYNGMTVMRIGTIAEFIKQEPTYIKGQLIRLETVQEDTNYINEIANELNKGVFI